MKARERRPAVTKAIAVFLNGSGTSEMASLSRIAANKTNTNVKPTPAPKEKKMHSDKLKFKEPCKRIKPSTMQLVVIKGK